MTAVLYDKRGPEDEVRALVGRRIDNGMKWKDKADFGLAEGDRYADHFELVPLVHRSLSNISGKPYHTLGWGVAVNGRAAGQVSTNYAGDRHKFLPYWWDDKDRYDPAVHGEPQPPQQHQAAVIPSHRFVQNSPTPGDPYRCTHPDCAEDWRPGQSQPTSRCPAETSTADILKQQAEQQARLEALNGEGDADNDDQGSEEGESGGESGSPSHEAVLSSLGNLVDAGAWHDAAGGAGRRPGPVA